MSFEPTAQKGESHCTIQFTFSIADPEPVLFLPPRSGMNFFRIPDLFDYDLDFAPESIRSKKKVCIPIFYVGSGIRDEKMFGFGMKNGWIRIRDNPSRIRNTGRNS
jgi:hypothetical protein